MNIDELYNEVIDETGHVKLCGHKKCKKLIDAMEALFPGEDFGDSRTGFVNRENIVKYYTHLRG